MSQLTTNTSSLQAILATVNALPEAGSGGGSGGGTCTVEILAVGPVPSMNLYYMDSTGSVIRKSYEASDLMMGITLTVKAITPIAADHVISSVKPPEGDIIAVGSYCYYVRGDGTIYLGT